MGLDKFSIIDIEPLIAPEIFQRGEAYYREGHLIEMCYLDNEIAGILLGTGGKYQARIWIDNSNISWECSCPYPDFCKHLIALAIAWVENRSRFTNLNQIVTEKVAQPEILPSLVRQLIKKNPFDFIELCQEEETHNDQFMTNRGLFNLIRNIFARPCLHPHEAEALWERVELAIQRLNDKLLLSDPEILEGITQLWDGLVKGYRNYPYSILKEALIKYLCLIRELPQFYQGEQLQQVINMILESYFQKDMWEISSELQDTIITLIQNEEVYFEHFIHEFLNGKLDFFLICAVYELLDRLVKKTDDDKLLRIVESEVAKTSEGKLWLIDKWIDSSPGQALKLTRQELKNNTIDKSALRERLIKIHQKQEEYKQAAYLCYLQFLEQPSHEEYSRLTDLLQKHPEELKVYQKKIEGFLIDKDLRQIWLAIKIIQQEAGIIAANLLEICSTPSLVALLVKELTGQFQMKLKEIYQNVIRQLIESYCPDNKIKIRELLIICKKGFYQNGLEKEWEIFRQELNQRVDPHIILKFKKILMG